MNLGISGFDATIFFYKSTTVTVSMGLEPSFYYSPLKAIEIYFLRVAIIKKAILATRYLNWFYFYRPAPAPPDA